MKNEQIEANSLAIVRTNGVTTVYVNDVPIASASTARLLLSNDGCAIECSIDAFIGGAVDTPKDAIIKNYSNA